MEELKVGRYKISLTHSNKRMMPPNITKADLINYYDRIGDIMVPYVKNRPLMMHRFPEGIEGESFYQKDASAYFPDWIKRAKTPKEGGFNNYVVCQNRATLVYLANQACITPHIWLSRIDKLEFPDRMIFDFDAETENFENIRFMALAMKTVLTAMNLASFVMTTGSRGLHVIVPIDRKLAFKDVRNFSQACALQLVHAFPEKATLELRKEKRGDKIFIDTLRNQYGATAVAPYAIRAKPGAPVATPLHWHEVEDSTLTAQKYTINNLFERLKKVDDPWEGLLGMRQSLKKASKIITS